MADPITTMTTAASALNTANKAANTATTTAETPSSLLNFIPGVAAAKSLFRNGKTLFSTGKKAVAGKVEADASPKTVEKQIQDAGTDTPEGIQAQLKDLKEEAGITPPAGESKNVVADKAPETPKENVIVTNSGTTIITAPAPEAVTPAPAEKDEIGVAENARDAVVNGAKAVSDSIVNGAKAVGNSVVDGWNAIKEPSESGSTVHQGHNEWTGDNRTVINGQPQGQKVPQPIKRELIQEPSATEAEELSPIIYDGETPSPAASVKSATPAVPVGPKMSEASKTTGLTVAEESKAASTYGHFQIAYVKGEPWQEPEKAEYVQNLVNTYLDKHPEHGIAKVAEDGKYGEGSQNAVVALQQKLGLEVTGVADQNLAFTLGKELSQEIANPQSTAHQQPTDPLPSTSQLMGA